MKRRQCIILSTLLLSSLGAEAEGFNESSCIRFCNEPLPVYENQVLHYFQSALLHTASMPLHQIKPRAQKFFQVIDPILKQYQIPLDFKYLCVVESALNPKAISHKGAYGYWQFMPHTARAMGLVVDGPKDERENLVKSTHAACQYFLDLYRQLGSWSLVAAAYNAGPTKVKRYLSARGKTSYYNLRISAENRRYLYRVLAAKELFTRPELYALVISEEMTLQKFIRQQGLALGLIAPLKIKVKAAKNNEWLLEETESTLNEGFLTGFDELISLSFKRNGAFRHTNLEAVDELEFGQSTDSKPSLYLWRAPRVNSRRRNDLKALLAEARSKTSRTPELNSNLA
ncbi:lytic transglycosylase domain-containing protein [Runella sp.]|uniref:lytic transglycosylase domain-containing protein n=1 Tax=Runella sp. TaxID=1960881 RepID=UPI003D0B1C40